MKIVSAEFVANIALDGIVYNIMKIINSQKELEQHIGYNFYEDAYDADANWVISEMEYNYPILVECLGYTHKGEAWKVREKKDLDELKKFLNL